MSALTGNRYITGGFAALASSSDDGADQEQRSTAAAPQGRGSSAPTAKKHPAAADPQLRTRASKRRDRAAARPAKKRRVSSAPTGSPPDAAAPKTAAADASAPADTGCGGGSTPQAQVSSQGRYAVGVKTTLPGGVTVELLRAAAEGAHVAVKNDVVKLIYEGRLEKQNGKLFDNGDIDFVLGDMTIVHGLDRGVSGMRVGERAQIYVPAKLGYGKKGKRPKVPPHSDLWFDISLVSAGVDWHDMTIRARCCVSAKNKEAKKRRRKKCCH